MARDYTLQKDRAPRTWWTRSSEEAEGAKKNDGYKPSPGTALQSECRLPDWLHFRIYISIYLLWISCKSTLPDSKPQDLQTWYPPAEKRLPFGSSAEDTQCEVKNTDPSSFRVKDA
jgi:hypothetical protein